MIKAKSQDQPDMGGRVILFGRPASSGGEPGEVAVGGGAPPPCRGGREGEDGGGGWDGARPGLDVDLRCHKIEPELKLKIGLHLLLMEGSFGAGGRSGAE